MVAHFVDEEEREPISIELDQWNQIYHLKKVLYTYIDQLQQSMRSDIDTLNKNITMDSAIKQQALNLAISKLEEIVKEIEWKHKQYIEEKNNVRKTG